MLTEKQIIGEPGSEDTMMVLVVTVDCSAFVLQDPLKAE